MQKQRENPQGNHKSKEKTEINSPCRLSFEVSFETQNNSVVVNRRQNRLALAIGKSLLYEWFWRFLKTLSAGLYKSSLESLAGGFDDEGYDNR
jgi:hypothetical protein